MSEKQITEKIIDRLKSEGFWVFKVHGGGLQKAGIPDVLACRAGRLYAFEVKRPGFSASRLQLKRIRELEAAGAVVAVVSSVEDVLEALTHPA
jgi:Holliday junction resolvase